MQSYQFPANVCCVSHLDSSIEKRLQKEGKNSIVDHDNDLVIIQKKIQEVLGPQGATWVTIELHIATIIPGSDLEADSLTDQLQEGAILLRYAMVPEKSKLRPH